MCKFGVCLRIVILWEQLVKYCKRARSYDEGKGSLNQGEQCCRLNMPSLLEGERSRVPAAVLVHSYAPVSWDPHSTWCGQMWSGEQPPGSDSEVVRALWLGDGPLGKFGFGWVFHV